MDLHIHPDIGDIPSSNSTLPDDEFQNSEDDWFWNSDPDVILATLSTALIGLVLILKSVFNWWQNFRNRRRERRESGGGGGDENSEERRANAQRRIDEAFQRDDHECPICLSSASFPVLTDCGHTFCCQCIINYWQHSKSIVSPCDCAMCRSTFHMLLPVRWPQMGDSEEVNDKIHENNIRINDYNRRFSNNRPILDYLRDIPILVPYLIRNFFTNDIFTLVYQIRIGFVFLCVLAYFILPSDMVPESIYGIIGFLDDCVIGLVFIGALIRWLRTYMADRGLANHDD